MNWIFKQGSLLFVFKVLAGLTYVIISSSGVKKEGDIWNSFSKGGWVRYSTYEAGNAVLKDSKRLIKCI